MTRGRIVVVAIVAALVLASPVLWWLVSPLFIDRAVNEDFPGSSAIAVAASAAPSSAPASVVASIAPVASSSPVASAAASPTAQASASASASATPAPSPTSNGPVAVKSGQFHAVEHPGSGTATIYELPDGSRTLRLENFATDNGPDLYVYLSAAPDSNDEQTVLNNEYVSLGQLKGNQGNQNYELPADLDVAAYNSVTVWCQQFSVNFTTAPLQ
jgi:hypothetical protein